MFKFKKDDTRPHIKPHQTLDVHDVLKSFPFPSFRRYQKEVIEGIVEAFNSGCRWILLETPTGFGKSPVNVAFCRTMQSFYTTPQNILLDQLRHDFPDLALIKGRKHYRCAEGGNNCAEGAPCKRDPDYKCRDRYNRCPYWAAKIRAIEAQTALTNFSYLIGEGFIHGNPNVPHFGNRELLVVDEGHNIDQHILDQISISVGGRSLPYPVYRKMKEELLELPDRLTKDKIDELLNGAVLYCKQFLKLLPTELSREQVKEEERATKFIRRVKNYWENRDADWVGQVRKKVYERGTWVEAKIQPIYVRNFMQDYLWKRAERFIISSATIFIQDFVKECGLSDHADEVWYTHTPSTFPIQNRRVVDATVGSLSWSKKRETLPAALDAVSKIIAIEGNKGIVHAHSYAFAEAIRNGVPNPRLLFHESDSRQDVLNKFLDSPPAAGRVLVAVAMTEGLDLIGDKATFQIMFKCPFANYVEDLRVRRRLKELHHNRWYAVQTLKKIIQAYGRAVRSPEDKAAFYIIDSDVNRICKRWRRQLPRFFREAYDAREQLP